MSGADFLSTLLRKGAEVAHTADDELDWAGRVFRLREDISRPRAQIEA